MNVQEQVIEGVLCRTKDEAAGLIVPYSLQELTNMILKLRLDLHMAQHDAARWRIARTMRFGLGVTSAPGDKKKSPKSPGVRMVVFDSDADQVLDQVIIHESASPSFQ